MEIIKKIFLLVLFSINLYSYTSAQNIEVLGDTIEVELKDYKAGKIQWQFSTDKQNWENLSNANTEKLICTAIKTGFFRAKVEYGTCPYLSDNTFIYTQSSDTSKTKITDEGANIKIQWNFDISPLLISRYLIEIEGMDTTILVDSKINELTLPRKIEYYNRNFTIKATTTWGIQLPQQTIKYKNNYSQFFTCKYKYIAHRGLSFDYPENTRIAFEKAAEAGFEYVECDIWLSKDHQWVVIHDDAIDRTSDGTGKVSQLTLEELQKFNFGNPKKYGNKYPQQIISLIDFVAMCKEKNIKPLIEIKQGNIGELDLKSMIDITNNKLTYDHYAFHCFDSKILQTIRKKDKNSILGFITWQFSSLDSSILKELYPCFYNINNTPISMDQPFNEKSNTQIYHFLKNGIYVSIWAVDDSKYFENLSNNNLFITTDILPPIFKQK